MTPEPPDQGTRFRPESMQIIPRNETRNPEQKRLASTRIRNKATGRQALREQAQRQFVAPVAQGCCERLVQGFALAVHFTGSREQRGFPMEALTTRCEQ
jgi:hypothetical protein